MTKIEKELSFLFIAYQFAYLHIKQVVEDKGESAFKLLEKPTKFLMSLDKIVRMYSKQSNRILDKATEIYADIEKEAVKITPNKKFTKRIRVDENKDVHVNGLLFAVSLILEHRNFKSKKLIPNYKLANEIMSIYEKEDLNKSQMNSRLMAQKYFDKLESIDA